MSSVIKVENLSKRYVIGHQRDASDGLRHALENAVRNPFKWLLNRKRRLTATREEFWALKDVSFEIKQGEVVGIIGRNGAGKSTLLKILSRITEPTNGRVEINGRVASLLEVGTGFHQELTGRENIFLNGAILGMSKAEIKRKFDEIVAFSEIEKFLDTPVKRYSSGMYVRLAFAVAAHLEPEILIVDEVLAVGDVEFQKKCLGKIGEVSRGGRTVLFVSHNMSAVRNLCNRALMLVKGGLSFIGETSAAIDHYSQHSISRTGMTWKRPDTLPMGSLGFQSVQATLTGKNPQLHLNCELELRRDAKTEAVLIAVDICDRSLTPIMQALPSPKPFINGQIGSNRVLLEVDLPPLVPGHYALDFWIGSHFSNTMDHVKNVVSFEITESPTLGRNFPHSIEHGFVVPLSRCRITNNNC